MKRLIATLSAASMLAGCSMQPTYQRPEAPVPVFWPQGDAYLAQSERSLASLDYTQVFADRRLQTIITDALATNRDLRQAAANIASARAQYRIQRANLLPEISGSGGVTVRKGPQAGLGGVGNPGGGNQGGGNQGGGNNSGGGNGGGGLFLGGSDETQTFYTAQVGATAFEIDLFGRVRSLNDAALNQYFATEAAARATRLALVGDIATGWLTYGADKSLLAIAQDTVDSAKRSVDLTEARLKGGVAPRTDLRQAQTVLEQARADLAEQQTALAQDVNRLRLLVGADFDTALLPQSIEDATSRLGEVPAGLSSDILLRRPDVVQAEYQLRSMNAQIGAARAALFPRISLTAVLGLASTSLSGLFDGDGFNWQVSPNVSYPIFRAGAGRAGVAQAEAEEQASLANYEKTIQTAFREVADALARRGTIDRQLAAVRALTDATQDTYNLAIARYKGGIDTYLQSLDAQRSLYTARRSLVQVQLTRATNLATLYQALGGDSTLVASKNGPVPVQDASDVP
ncbi:efflux transporter outer membrane subunit [Stakelama pacifica]|uniref:Multidrug efflux system outer membrane protein n=1 Tax=Stakelama pacifica TaxID=517720 RepID=A0A4R6G0E2_9SPHN|nr:efflux transporter outer membrane subunit [Stakelama pacifica]TDN86934.1 multidrug efflux system outer membrane protein [Stakelama pacifica]GGO91105.1 adeC/adeK/oprM family multidrug efflux complex outer membrane factor [Stakelama pacifica]